MALRVWVWDVWGVADGFRAEEAFLAVVHRCILAPWKALLTQPHRPYMDTLLTRSCMVRKVYGNVGVRVSLGGSFRGILVIKGPFFKQAQDSLRLSASVHEGRRI